MVLLRTSAIIGDYRHFFVIIATLTVLWGPLKLVAMLAQGQSYLALFSVDALTSTEDLQACLCSGGRKCALIGVPWRGVSFSTLSTG